MSVFEQIICIPVLKSLVVLSAINLLKRNTLLQHLYGMQTKLREWISGKTWTPAQEWYREVGMLGIRSQHSMSTGDDKLPWKIFQRKETHKELEQISKQHACFAKIKSPLFELFSRNRRRATYHCFRKKKIRCTLQAISSYFRKQGTSRPTNPVLD